MPVPKIATVMLAAAALCMCTSALAQSDLEDVGKVKDYYADWLSSIPGVTNVGVGEGPGGPPEIDLKADVITDQTPGRAPQLQGFPHPAPRHPRHAYAPPPHSRPQSPDHAR